MTDTDPSFALTDSQLAELKKALKEAQENGLIGPDIPNDLDELLEMAERLGLSPDLGQVTSSKPYALPASKTAVLLGACIDPTLNNIPMLARMLTARGYDVQAGHQLSLVALRALPGKNIGVLYLMSHATSDHVFGLAADDDIAGRTPEDKARREEDEAADLVKQKTFDVLGADAQGNPDASNMGKLNGYSTRMGFFNKYWKGRKIFAENSLVYINACDVRDKEFIDLLKGCGAGTILAWNAEVWAGLSTPTANYIFDRLLGTNVQDPTFYPEPLPQRPWSWAEIAVNIKQQKARDYTLGGPYKNPFSVTSRVSAELVSYGDNAGPLLVPSIWFLQVDEFKKRLTIGGWLGPDPGPAGTVTIYDALDQSIKGKTLPVETGKWGTKHGTITCILPDDGSITSGYVVVAVDGRRSNCIPLTEWKGEITAVARGDQSIQETGTLSFSIRMDAHHMRMDFTESPLTVLSYRSVNDIRGAMAAPHSTCHSAASGSAHYDPPQGELSDQSVSGDVTILPATSDENGLSRIGTDVFTVSLTIIRTLKSLISSPQETMDLVLQAGVPRSLPPNQSHAVQTLAWTTTKSRKAPETEDMLAFSWLSEFGDLVNVKQQTSYALPEQNRSIEVNVGPFKRATYKVTSTVLFPPDPQKGEDYQPVI